AEWRALDVEPPKDRDFALGLGPVVVTPDDPDARRARGVFPDFDWMAAIDFAAAGTVLFPGDIVACPAAEPVEGVEAGATVQVRIDGIGALEQRVAG
ncbi:MAG TPA: hypothetical protein VFO56_06555, partial [Gaiellaceae bacterium]|nr:hypothetical protein [Gaiellaceae bacterium]